MLPFFRIAGLHVDSGEPYGRTSHEPGLYQRKQTWEAALTETNTRPHYKMGEDPPGDLDLEGTRPFPASPLAFGYLLPGFFQVGWQPFLRQA